MFSKRFRLGSLLGFPIYLDLSWFLIVIVLAWMLATLHFPIALPDLKAGTYWMMGIAGTLGLFLSVLLHELGHAVAARRCGLEMRGITLFIFGGVAEMADEPQQPKHEFIVAIAGPLVTLVIVVLTFAITAVGPLIALPEPVSAVVFYLAVINFILLVFNMVPAFPLDGGRVLRALLWQLKGSLRWATRITSSIGAGFGLFLIVMGVFALITGNVWSAIWMVIIGLFLRSAANMSYQQLLVRRALEGEPVQRFMSVDPVSVRSDLTLQALVDDFVYETYHKLYPIVDNGHVTGCVTTQQVKQVPREQWDSVTVADIAQECTPENTISYDSDAMDALARMNRNGISRLMVLDGEELVGVLSLKDLLGFLSLKVELEQEHVPVRQVNPINHQD